MGRLLSAVKTGSQSLAIDTQELDTFETELSEQVEDDVPLMVEEEESIGSSPDVWFEELEQSGLNVEEERQRVVNRAIDLLHSMFENINEDLIVAIKAVAIEAFQFGSQRFGKQAAAEWGGEFSIPQEAVLADRQKLEEFNYDLEKVVDYKKGLLKPDRLSQERIEQTLDILNPERDKMLTLANHGMVLHPEEDFIPNLITDGPDLSAVYRQVAPAVNRMFYESFWQRGFAILMDKEKAMDVPGVHSSKASWASKELKECGRPITDMSAKGKRGCLALNSLSTKEACERQWGTIKHPTIDDLVRMVMDFLEEHLEEAAEGQLDMVLWKMDLRGAYTLIDFQTDQVPQVAMELTDELVMFVFVGVFGWTGTPFAFQTVTRALLWELRRPNVLQGKVNMYCDDIMGVSHRQDVERDMAAAEKLCTNLLGPDAVESSKSVFGKALDFIGYHIDLKTMLVSVKHRNMLRTLYGFLEIDVDQPVTLFKMQQLASWAARYANICTYLNPLKAILYGEFTGKRHRMSWQLEPATKVAIKIFRALLLATATRGTNFVRSALSFAKEKLHDLVVEFDASLTGIGCVWYSYDVDTGTEVPVGFASWSIESLELESQPAFQNFAEFLGGVMAIVGALAFIDKIATIVLRGDSVCALTWAEKWNFNGHRTRKSAFVFILLLMKTGVKISGFEHISSEDNWLCDGLSRSPDITNKMAERLGDAVQIMFDVTELKELVNPKIEWEEEDEFASFFRQANRIVDNLINNMNPVEHA